jgi:hypothetical protein
MIKALWTEKEIQTLKKGIEKGLAFTEIKETYFPLRSNTAIENKIPDMLTIAELTKYREHVLANKIAKVPPVKVNKETLKKMENKQFITGPWTEEEIDMLVKGKQEGLSSREVQSLYLNHRTVDSVSCKMSKVEVTDRAPSAKDKYMENSLVKFKQKQAEKLEEKWELFLAAMKECMAKVKDVPCLVGKYNKDEKKSKEVPVLMLTDLHIGEKHEGEGEEYNKEIFQNRMAYLTSKVLSISKNILSKAYYMPELKIFMLGDMITGECIFPTQSFQIDLNLTQQIFQGAKIVSENINQLSKYFKKITVISVGGNHGRLGAFNDPKNSYDYFFYKAVEAALQNNRRVEFQIEENDFKQIIDIEGHQFMLFHGDGIKGGGNGTPLYGIIRAVSNWTSMYIEKYPKLKYFCLGHFHTAAQINWNLRKIILGGTFNSGGQFSSKEIKTASSISQWFFGVSKSRGITWSYELGLDKIKEIDSKQKFSDIVD